MSSLSISYEIIFVDDGSKDKTAEVINSLENVRLIQHSQNKGYGAALKSGIKSARGYYILITDADGTYPVSEIPRLVQYMGSYDMVVGARTGQDVNIQLYRKPAKLFLKKLANYLTGTNIPDLNSGLRIFKKDDAIKYFNIICDGFSFTTTITLSFLCNNLSIKYVPINYHCRVGKSKIKPFKDGLNFILLIINTITYFNPLKVFLPISLAFFLGGVFVFSYSVLFLKIIFDSTVLIFIVSSVQILLFGLLADLNVKKSSELMRYFSEKGSESGNEM